MSEMARLEPRGCEWGPKIVVGLGFGDEGKGMTVAHEVETASRRGLRPVVVRFNGGPQAQHNVRVRRGGMVLHHVHSQFGSGALLGADTVIEKGMLFDPIAFDNELAHLSKVMGIDMSRTVSVSNDCPIVTPLHAAANMEIEASRGNARHGSTGRGIGVARTCDDDAATGHAYREMRLTVRDVFTNRAGAGELIRKLYYWRSYIDMRFGTHLWDTVCDEELWAMSLRLIDSMHAGRINLRGMPVARLIEKDDVALVFEGSQGMMLDKRVGWFPHVTYGDMDAFEARRLCGNTTAKVIGVTRSYQTRHGAGPMPTEGTCEIPENDNETYEWAGAFRTGLLDIPNLARAAAATCVDEIAVSHMDRYPGRCVTHWEGWGREDGVDRAVPCDMRVKDMDEGLLFETIHDECKADVTVIGRGPVLSDWSDRK